MNRTFGFLFFMLFLAAFALVMLKGRDTAQREERAEIKLYDIANLYNRTWRPTSIDGDEVPEGTDIFIVIGDEGGVNGYGGCNSFFGTITENDDGFKIGPLGATRKACAEFIMDREMAFFRVIELSRSFNATPDDLEMVDQNGNVMATLEYVLEP